LIRKQPGNKARNNASHRSGASPALPKKLAVGSTVKDRLRRGASIGLEQGAVESYFAHHWYSARTSLLRLMQTPLSSSLTWLVIATVLALPVGLMIFLKNIEGLVDNLEDASRLTLYMHVERDDRQLLQVAEQINARADVEAVEFIGREQALEEFERVSGWNGALAYLDQNPLPSVIVVQPEKQFEDPEQISRLVADLEALSGVESVQVDMQWIKRLYALLGLLERFVIALSTLFCAAVILIVGNTLRLSIENRREEIVVVKLVGGTDAFVTRPFLYTGFWFGMVGALLALLIVNLALLWLQQPVNQVADLYFSQFVLSGLSFFASTGLLLLGGLLGILGAWLAVNRHLDDIEPA